MISWAFRLFKKRNFLTPKLTKLEKQMIRLPVRYVSSAESKNTRFVLRSLEPEFLLYDQLCGLLVQLLLRVQQSEKTDDPFMDVFLLLGNKVLSHLRSIKACCLQGWHGTAHSMLSLLVSDLNMLIHLGYRRDLIAEWFSEGQDTYQTNKRFQKNFNESAISKTLEENGIIGSYPVFQVFRKTTHGSFWGAQVYTVKGRLVIAPHPPDVRMIIATLGLASMFVSTLLHWLLMDQPTFGSFAKENKYDSLRQIHGKLNESVSQFMHTVSGFLAETKGLDERIFTRHG